MIFREIFEETRSINYNLKLASTVKKIFVAAICKLYGELLCHVPVNSHNYRNSMYIELFKN